MVVIAIRLSHVLCSLSFVHIDAAKNTKIDFSLNITQMFDL